MMEWDWEGRWKQSRRLLYFLEEDVNVKQIMSWAGERARNPCNPCNPCHARSWMHGDKLQSVGIKARVIHAHAVTDCLTTSPLLHRLCVAFLEQYLRYRVCPQPTYPTFLRLLRLLPRHHTQAPALSTAELCPYTAQNLLSQASTTSCSLPSTHSESACICASQTLFSWYNPCSGSRLFIALPRVFQQYFVPAGSPVSNGSHPVCHPSTCIFCPHNLHSTPTISSASSHLPD